jgi:hypothetical protein
LVIGLAADEVVGVLEVGFRGDAVFADEELVRLREFRRSVARPPI